MPPACTAPISRPRTMASTRADHHDVDVVADLAGRLAVAQIVDQQPGGHPDGRDVDQVGEGLGLLARPGCAGRAGDGRALVQLDEERPAAFHDRDASGRRGPRDQRVASASSRHEQRFLVVEVGVGRGLGQPGGPGDLRHRRGAVAAGTEVLDGHSSRRCRVRSPFVAVEAARSGDGRRAIAPTLLSGVRADAHRRRPRWLSTDGSG